MTSNIITNERELASKIAQWFDAHIQRNNFPFTSASNEPGVKVGKKTLFGDIVIWENRESNKAYSYIELKPPFGAKEDLETFRKKAIVYNVKIAYTWDFQNINAYKIENNKLYPLDSESHSVLTNINDWKRGDIQADIKTYIYKICDELLEVSEKGKFYKFKPEKHYFVEFIRKTVNNLIPVFENFIRKEHRKKDNKPKINKYVIEQGITFPSDEEFYKLIARQRVYGLITKIIFYLTIRRYFKDLPPLQQDDEDDISEILNTAFAKASEKDWQAVFVPGPIAELGIPEEAHSYLQELFSHLKIYNFGKLPEDVIGELFEEIIDPEQRHHLGQFFTKEDLVDLIIATIVDDDEQYYADPTCGSGTFLIRLYSRLKYLNPRLKHDDILDRIWGVDIGKFPAELSTINLFRQDFSSFDNFPRVLNKNIFDIKKGSSFEFPPPNVGNNNYNKIDIDIPEFYGLVGNFPFIRQELIEKKVPGVKKELTKLLAEEYLFSYPKLFEFKKNTMTVLPELEKQKREQQIKTIHTWIDNKDLELRLSGKADIYTYIYIHTATLLSKNGSFAIITSNSWLDVAYGSVLKEFFLDHFKIKMIVGSWAEPWFEEAAVNTIFTVLEKADKKNERDKNLVHFVKLKKKFEELIPERDLQLESIKRWQRIDRIINTIESAQYKSKEITDKINSYENDDMLVRMMKQIDLIKEQGEREEFSQWGKYFRAPDVYFEILNSCKDRLVPLKKIAKIRRGVTTGINEFFYLEKIEEKDGKIKCKNARGWEGIIERKYLKQVIKSPKESQSIRINSDHLKYLIFLCNKSKEQLKHSGDLDALNYIEWGENQRTKNNISWENVPSVSGRHYWWALKEKDSGPILFQMVNNNRFVSYLNNDKVQVDHNLFEFLLKDELTINTAKYYLNSTVFALIKEVNSRVNLGDGATKTEGIDWKNLMLIPKDILIIKFKSDNFFSRKTLSIFEEVKQKDRQELDKAVLRALGLNPDEYLSKIYEGITEMVRERLELPKMRKKKQKQKVQVSYQQVKESVIKECIGKTLKLFPEAFYTIGEVGKDYDDLEFEVYYNNGKPLQMEHFLGYYTVKDESGKEIFTTNNIDKARFAIYLAKPKVIRIKIPKDAKVVESIVKNYRNYINQLREIIELNANQKLHSWNDAEKMTKEILEEYNLSING